MAACVRRGEHCQSQAIRCRRDEVVLATKFGNVRDEQGNFLGVNGRPEYVRQCCDASLQRLGVEQIDLYYPEEDVAALEIELSAGDLAELAQAAPVGRTAGARYPASSMAAVNR